jgi:hypothetical protein
MQNMSACCHVTQILTQWACCCSFMQASNTAASEQLQQLATQKQRLVTQQAQLLASLESATANSTTCSLAGSIAAAEAKLQSLQAAAAAAVHQAAELSSCKGLLQQHENRAGQLRTMLHMKRDAAAQAARSLQAMQDASSAADGLRQQALQMQKQAAAAAAALAQQQAATEHRQEQLRQATARADGIEQQLRTTRPGHDADASAAAARAAAAAAAEHGQHMAALQQQLLQLQTDQEMTQNFLTPQHIAALLSACHRTGGSSSVNSSSIERCALPLHQCFSLKGAADPQSISQLLLPLSVIAGPAALQVLVANTMQDANELLAAAAGAKPGHSRGNRGNRGSSSNGGGKLRIWPLEQLQPYNMLRAQRAAQQAIGAARVIFPLDLLQYDSMYEPAMLRAFGGYVIAADDVTAAELVQRFGLSSVTLQGTVSRKGSMSGGWTGNSGGQGQTLWTYKLQHDSLADQAALVQQQLVRAHEQQQSLEQQRNAAAAELAAAEQRQALQRELQQQQAQVATAAQLLQQEQHCLEELQQQHSSVQQRLQQCKDAMPGAGGASSSSSKQAAAALKQQLQEDARMAAEAVEEAEQQLQAAEEEV